MFVDYAEGMFLQNVLEVLEGLVLSSLLLEELLDLGSIELILIWCKMLALLMNAFAIVKTCEDEHIFLLRHEN